MRGSYLNDPCRELRGGEYGECRHGTPDDKFCEQCVMAAQEGAMGSAADLVNMLEELTRAIRERDEVAPVGRDLERLCDATEHQIELLRHAAHHGHVFATRHPLPKDEAAIVLELLGRMMRARHVYGPWDVDDERDYHQEALEELIDGLAYLTAELLRLKKRRQREVK